MSPRPHIDEKTRLRCLLARFLFLTDIYGRQKLVTIGVLVGNWPRTLTSSASA